MAMFMTYFNNPDGTPLNCSDPRVFPTLTNSVGNFTFCDNIMAFESDASESEVQHTFRNVMYTVSDVVFLSPVCISNDKFRSWMTPVQIDIADKALDMYKKKHNGILF